MTPENVRYCAEVALYTKIHAIRLMQAGNDAGDLAAVFLNLFFAKDFDRESLATPEDAENLLVFVASGYDPAWQSQHRFQEPPPGPDFRFDAHDALLDLSKTCWLWRIVEHLKGCDAESAELAAYRFLRLRERVRSLSFPVRVLKRHGTDLVRTLCRFVADHSKSERIQRDDRPYIAPRRRTARRPGFRGLGF